MKLDAKTIGQISHKLTSAFDLALNEGTHSEKVDPRRMTMLRLSGLPFCPVKWFMDLPRMTSKSQRLTSSSKYFTHVGHVLHGVMQNALAEVGIDAYGIQLIADWKCLECSKKYAIQKRPVKCSCGCKSFKFEEVEILRGRVTGHVDTILSMRLKSSEEEFWIVVDYKTTSTWKIKTKGKLPLLGNVFQIGGYVGQLHEMGYPVLPLAYLVYVPRDNPWNYKLCDVKIDLKDEIRRMKLYEKRFLRVASLSRSEELKEVVESRPCRKELLPDFAGCAYAGLCAGPKKAVKIEGQLKSVFERVKGKLPIIKEDSE